MTSDDFASILHTHACSLAWAANQHQGRSCDRLHGHYSIPDGWWWSASNTRPQVVLEIQRLFRTDFFNIRRRLDDETEVTVACAYLRTYMHTPMHTCVHTADARRSCMKIMYKIIHTHIHTYIRTRKLVCAAYYRTPSWMRGPVNEDKRMSRDHPSWCPSCSEIRTYRSTTRFPSRPLL